MNTIIERITEAIKEILIGMIQNGLEGMFTEVNDKVGTIAGQVGQTPQGWNSGVFNLIQNLSQTVIVPIAGLIITFVLCYELITMVTQKNNFHEFETYNIFLWIFKAYIAIYLVTNTFNITMAVFDVGQHIVNGAAGVISSDTALDVKALEQVQPRDLDASEIEVRLGATWIEPKIYRDFMEEMFHTPAYLVGKVIEVRYSEASGTWNISGKNADSYRNALTTVTYGTSRANAYKILEDSLNLKDVQIYDHVLDDMAIMPVICSRFVKKKRWICIG